MFKELLEALGILKPIVKEELKPSFPMHGKFLPEGWEVKRYSSRCELEIFGVAVAKSYDGIVYDVLTSDVESVKLLEDKFREIQAAYEADFNETFERNRLERQKEHEIELKRIAEEKKLKEKEALEAISQWKTSLKESM